MSSPTSAMIARAAVVSTPGDLIQARHRCGERGDHLLDEGSHMRYEEPADIAELE
jgi:hypothetical protein